MKAPSTGRPKRPAVTACIPFHGGRRYIRRAVESLLAQTCEDMQIVVVNDGDRNEPWDELASLRDPRLVCFNLVRNHGGPFFAYAVVAEAAASPWFLVQEQDDWSEPGRVEQLLRSALDSKADFATSAQIYHRQKPQGNAEMVGLRWQHTGRAVCPRCRSESRCQPRCQECFVDTSLTPQYWYRAPHAGLFRMELLRRIGGYYAGLHLHFDALLMNILLMTGNVAHTPAPLYHRLLRRDSITHSRETGFGSPASNHERRIVAELYQQCFSDYRRFVRGEIDSQALALAIRNRLQRRVTERERAELSYEVRRLRAHLDRIR